MAVYVLRWKEPDLDRPYKVVLSIHMSYVLSVSVDLIIVLQGVVLVAWSNDTCQCLPGHCPDLSKPIVLPHHIASFTWTGSVLHIH